MAVVSMKQLLEAGVHFGHQTRRWNPKMAEYIYCERNGIYIIDLQKTVKKLEEAYSFVRNLAENGQTILFVGTKKQAADAVKEEASRVGMYYVNARWLGGMLTNFKTMRTRIDRLAQLKKMQEDGTFDMLPKKEVMKLLGEMEKLEKYLGGVKEMKKLPGALFVVDPRKEHNAIAEARKLHIPIVAINNDVGLTELTYHIIDLIIQDGITQIRTANLENLLCRDAAESDYHRQITELTGVLEPFSQSVFVRTKENIPLNSFRIASEDFLLPLFDGMLYFINGKNEQHLNEKRSAFVHKLRSSSTSYRLGIGSIHESDALKRTLQESLHAFSFADFLKKNSCHYADLREYRLLLQLNGSDCLREWRDVFYVPLQESDLNAKLDLLHLMELYVKKDGDYTSISNELFIHESTVRYRLNKIYEILGLHSSTQFYAEAKLAVYANWILQDSLLRRLK